MTTAMMMDRTGMTMPGMGMQGAGATAAQPTGMNMMMVPRCTMTFEKCAGGVKIHCKCEDKVSAGMLQNLCTMMTGAMCSCCCMLNGMMMCCCNLTMGMCKCESTEMGVCITCTSGDKDCSRHDSGLLRLHDHHDEGRLHMLHDDEQHADVLRLLKSIPVRRSEPRMRLVLGLDQPGAACVFIHR